MDNSYIRYANCWEDADLLVDALSVQPGDKVLSVASAGDNSFSLLMNNPALVLAVDPNPNQLELVKLKKAAIKSLDRLEYLEFAGFRSSDNREELWNKVLQNLKEPEYWKANYKSISSGIIHNGKFENYFKLFRKVVMPLIHNKTNIELLLAKKTLKDQQEFYKKNWNNRRWRALFKLFFSKKVMGKRGRDESFFNEVEVDVADFIFNKAEHHLKDIACQQNCFLEYIFTGKFENNLPHYVREGNYERIKSNIDALKVQNEWIGEQNEQFNCFNLSNIFEYMDGKLFEEISNKINQIAIPEARFAYWNLMVPRSLTNVQDDIYELSLRTNKKDDGFFYLNFHANKKL